jgi:hypothetical protein
MPPLQDSCFFVPFRHASEGLGFKPGGGSAPRSHAQSLRDPHPRRHIAETTAEGILLRPAETPFVEIYTQERIAEFDAAESGLEQAVERGGCLTRPDWIARADEALKRAALRARDAAIQTNTGILVMVDGKVVKITAEELRAERDKGGASSQNSGAEWSEGGPR